MPEQLKIETNSLKLDDRAKIYLGRLNITRNVNKLVLVMDRNELTEVILFMKPDKIEIDTKVIKSKNILDKIVARITGAVNGNERNETDKNVDETQTTLDVATR